MEKVMFLRNSFIVKIITLTAKLHIIKFPINSRVTLPSEHKVHKVQPQLKRFLRTDIKYLDNIYNRGRLLNLLSPRVFIVRKFAFYIYYA